MFGGFILAVILGGALACVGRQDAPEADLMKFGGACNATEFKFEETLMKNEKRLRAKAVKARIGFDMIDLIGAHSDHPSTLAINL